MKPYEILSDFTQRMAEIGFQPPFQLRLGHEGFLRLTAIVMKESQPPHPNWEALLELERQFERPEGSRLITVRTPAGAVEIHE